MPQFRVTIIGSKPGGGVTQDGFLTKFVRFHIQRLADRQSFTYAYEGHGGGKLFELRCQLLLAAGGVLVESVDHATVPPDTAWKEAVVNLALQEAERLQ